MCGIVGYMGPRPAVPVVIEGLRRLQYRGYDSAGVAVHTDGGLCIVRATGKLIELEKKLDAEPLSGHLALGHTRWATHGRPSETNAHPHRTGGVAVIHNGIFENAEQIKARLTGNGSRFHSETDTEVLAHLVHSSLRTAKNLAEAVRKSLQKLKGSYAVAVMSESTPGTLVGARSGAPLIVGIGEVPGEYILASDLPALLPFTRRVIFLDDGDIAEITPKGITVTTMDGKKVRRAVTQVEMDPVSAEKGGYKHFMLKEIHEQPVAVSDALTGRLTARGLSFPAGKLDLQKIDRVIILGCGTSWHAAQIGRQWIEQLARLPASAEVASEFRYRDPVVSKSTLAIAVSQSGETADTLQALRLASERGAQTLAIVNALGSTMTREADETLLMHAGPEIGVASTKCFTNALVCLLLAAMELARIRRKLAPVGQQRILRELKHLPVWLEKVLRLESEIEKLAIRHREARNFLFLGRGDLAPVALEGALKLKEVSYIHAEGYPAGEMKHGPIAMLDRSFPVVSIMRKGAQLDKTASNLAEVRAREAPVIVIADRAGAKLAASGDDLITVPDTGDLVAPIILSVPLQLFAYHVAVHNGCDVDQPRNLAKSVTVE
ncbi:MAG: glutamine--fructose-6-phosphate transaminase (isomerizing) [Deltaproteobacteria bacterium]|nr:glutamine--fructose-6-phosphate transaminase (isomerizing) [Deltaproteobacteria bacterium]